ncbi:hypothetical protein D3C87_1133520 [compost metagenome]
MKCPAGTIEVSFWFPTLTRGGIYFDTVRDSQNINQCVGFIDSMREGDMEAFDEIITAVKPVLDLLTPKNQMQTNYYTLSPEEFEALTEGIHHEVRLQQKEK